MDGLDPGAVSELAGALLAPFLDPASRTYWVGLLLALGIAAVSGVRAGGRPLRRAVAIALHPSSRLDVQLLVSRQLLAALGLLPEIGGGLWLATHLVRWLDAAVGVPAVSVPPLAATVAYTAVTFAAWDLSRYALHRLMHRVPVLWAFHQVHHSAEVLTPLTFHRIHPVESVLYGLRGALVTGLVAGGFFWLLRDRAAIWTVLGVHGVGLAFNVVTGNLRHSHVWLRFGGAERWLLSPAQHQIHHAAGSDHLNYGTWLAVWDRLGGSLALAGVAPPERFGIPAPNHRHDLLSAWLGPLADAAASLRSRRARWLGALLLPVGARAADGADEADDTERDEASLEVLVEAEGGKPRVAGSAHVIGEDRLEQYDYDDIHAVLAEVPGVYVRGEDGFGLRPNIGIRGANADRSAKITLMEDGVLLAPAPYSAPAAYYFPMVTRMVAVEVFKGPASIQYGPYTIGGAINLQTRPVPSAPLAFADLALGNRWTARAHLAAGAGTERRGLLVEGVYLRTDGFKHLDDGGPTGFYRAEAVAKGRLATDPALARHQALELKLGYGRELSHETYLGLGVDDYAADPYRRYAATSGDLMRWDHTQVELAWPVDLGAVELRTVAYHHGLARVWTKFNRFLGDDDIHDLLQQPAVGQSEVLLAILRGEEDSVTPEQTLMIGTNDRRFAAMGVQTRARWTRYGERVSHRLEAGLRLHYDRVDRLQTEDPYQMRGGQRRPDGGETLVLDDDRAQATALAAHLHEDLDVSGFHVIPGVRTEIIQSERPAGEGGVLRAVGLPGLGLLAEVRPWLDLFAGAHRGFSPVPPGEPAEVTPERSWNVEGGLRAGGSTGPRLEAVGFLNEYGNITGQCTFSSGCSETDLDRQFNGGRARVIGVEGGASHELLLPHRLSIPVDVTYTWTRSAFLASFSSEFPQFGAVEPGDALPYVPEHQGSAHLSVSWSGRARIGAALDARAGMLDRAKPLADLGETDIPPLITLDLAADAQITRKLGAYLTATNVASASPVVSWRPFGARPPAPIQVMAGIRAGPR